MLIGVLGTGENPSSDEANDSLSTLNEIVDKWNVESLMIPSSISIELPLSNKKFYTIGELGDINSLRPPSGINNAYYVSDNLSHPISIITSGQYDSINLKEFKSDYPNVLYYNPSYPLAEIFIYPISSKGKVVLNVSNQFTVFNSLDTIIDLPSGYVKALRYNLAVELSTEYGRQLDPRIEAMAVGAKTFIKTTNGALKREVLTIDNALRGAGRFNIYSGGY